MLSSSERETSPSSSARRTRRSSDRRSEQRWGGPLTPLLVALAAGASLRAVGIEYGLPFGNLLNPDEQSIVPRAWKIVHGGGGDPHWFNYPSLLMYVNAPFQAWQNEPSFLTARVVAVALALMVKAQIELAGIAVGLATGFKYPGVFLVVPLVVAAWGSWRRLALAAVLMAAAFAASS